MPGKNSGVCHSCRATDHYFTEWPRKHCCPLCGCGYFKSFVVEKESSKSKGQMFTSCTMKRGHYVWVEDGESSGSNTQVESIGTRVAQQLANTTMEEVLPMFHGLARITDEENVEISFNVTIRKGNCIIDDNSKGKQKMKDS